MSLHHFRVSAVRYDLGERTLFDSTKISSSNAASRRTIMTYKFLDVIEDIKANLSYKADKANQELQQIDARQTELKAEQEHDPISGTPS